MLNVRGLICCDSATLCNTKSLAYPLLLHWLYLDIFTLISLDSKVITVLKTGFKHLMRPEAP